MNNTMTTPKRKSKSETEKDIMSILLGDENDSAETAAAPNTPLSLDIADLVPFTNHPFKLYEGNRLEDMVRSIKELGVLMPVIVRPNEDETYEILSGHNRVNAAKLAGLIEIPVIIKTGLTDEEAKLIVTETNLVQRSFTDLSHSERAIALKHHMDAISKQGKRNDLVTEIENLLNTDEIKDNGTCDPLEHKLKSRERTAKSYDLSPSNVTRYLRVAQLIKPLLDRVDYDEIAIRPAVSLSYLSETEQTTLNNILNTAAYKVDMKKAECLREFSECKKLTNEKMIQILSGEHNKKTKPKTAPPLKLKAKIYQKYFDENTTLTEMETVIEQALSEYFQNHKSKEDNE